MLLIRNNYFLLILLSVSALFFSGCTDSSEKITDSEVLVTKAGLRSFDIKVFTIGVLDASRSHMLSSDIPGDDGKILYIVDDGKHVKKNEVLVRIDQTELEERVQELSAHVLALESGIKAKEQMFEWEKNQVEKNITTAEFNLTVAQLEYIRLTRGDGPLQISQYTVEVAKARQEYDKYVSFKNELEKLAKDGIFNPTDLVRTKKMIVESREKHEAAMKTLTSYRDHVYPSLEKTAQAKVEKSETEILQVQNEGVIKIAKAVAELEEAKNILASKQAALDKARSELAKTELAAPFDGIAILYETFRDGEKRKPRVGDRIIRNQPILYLPDITSMIVKTSIREIDLHKISLKQKAVVHVDAYPDATLEGRVNFIGALATESNNRGTGGKYFQLNVVIDTQDLRLRPGMTARISIISDQIRNSLSVPVNAVFLEKGQPFCYTYSDSWYTKVAVNTGKQNNDFIEILSGLIKGDKVSLVKPAVFTETDRPQEESDIEG